MEENFKEKIVLTIEEEAYRRGYVHGFYAPYRDFVYKEDLMKWRYGVEPVAPPGSSNHGLPLRGLTVQDQKILQEERQELEKELKKRILESNNFDDFYIEEKMILRGLFFDKKLTGLESKKYEELSYGHKKFCARDPRTVWLT